MKALVISDVHANIDALRTVAEAERDADEIWCAGDLVDYGLDPCEVIAFVREHHVRCVRGNHDSFLLSLEKAHTPIPEGQYRFVDHCRMQMSAEDLAFLEGLPEVLFWEADGIEYCMAHMYDADYRNMILSRDAFARYWYKMNPNSSPEKEHRLIFGHTHRSCMLTLSDRMLWLNPGSVSYRRPDDPTKGADYAVIENGKITLRSTDYPRRTLYERMLALPLREDQRRVGCFFYGDE